MSEVNTDERACLKDMVANIQHYLGKVLDDVEHYIDRAYNLGLARGRQEVAADDFYIKCSICGEDFFTCSHAFGESYCLTLPWVECDISIARKET